MRLDFTFNWQKPTEIALRIQSIMPPDTAGAFSAFGWDAVNVVVQGLVEMEERPNLVKLTKYIEGGIEPVLEGTLRRYYERALGAGRRELPEMKKLLNDAHRGNIKRPSEAASADLLAFVAYYEHFVAQSQRNKVLDAQVRTFRHNREHYQKITANLLPVLASTPTSGDLGRSLSPESFDADDRRPIMNFEKIERAGTCSTCAWIRCPIRPWPPPSAHWRWPTWSALEPGTRYNLGGYRCIHRSSTRSRMSSTSP